MTTLKLTLASLFFAAVLLLGGQQVLAAQYPPACFGNYTTSWYENYDSNYYQSWSGAQVGAYAEVNNRCGGPPCGGTFEWAPLCRLEGGLYYSCVRLVGYACYDEGL